MSSSVGVDPEKVIARLSQQISAMVVELAMRDTALDAAHAELAELKKDDAEEA